MMVRACDARYNDVDGDSVHDYGEDGLFDDNDQDNADGDDVQPSDADIDVDGVCGDVGKLVVAMTIGGINVISFNAAGVVNIIITI